MTKREFVSEVVHHLNSLNKDSRRSPRYILSTAVSYIQYLINSRPLSALFRDINNFTSVDCVEMERIDKVSCEIAEFRVCDKIMRSKKKLPEIYSSTIGLLVESVTNIDSSTSYDKLNSIAHFKETQKRKFGGLFKYYIIQDNYLYILGSTPEIVSINFFPLDVKKAKELSSCEECDECASELDAEFNCPQAFLSTVRDQTIQLIAGTLLAIPTDENPDLDVNQKSKKQ